MTHKTRGIVLRTVKYGETSLVATIFTARFGVQAYMVNAVRTEKKSGSKMAMFQPGAILDMDVYHHPQKSMNRIKEYAWGFMYDQLFNDVVKNSISLYMLELMYKTLRQPEENSALYDFCEDALMQLDSAGTTVTANFALYFSLHLAYFFGLHIQHEHNGKAQTQGTYLDLLNGCFCPDPPAHPYFMEGEPVQITSELLRVMQPSELAGIPLNRQMRRLLLMKYLEFYSLHIPEFGQMKSLRIIQQILED